MIETAEDALAVALHETGLVDLDRVAELLGRSRETAIAELGERIFLDPEATVALNREIWVTADAYLSGKIRDKLTAAQAAAALDPRYQRNVAALEKTLPEDLKPSDITARLGAPWIPADVVAAFAEEVLGVKTPVYHTVEIAELVDQRPCLRWPGELLDRLGHVPSPCRRTLDRTPSTPRCRRSTTSSRRTGSRNGSSTPPTPKPPRTSS